MRRNVLNGMRRVSSEDSLSREQKRLEAGDISPLEVQTARIESLQANQDAARIWFEIPLAEERLKNLTGLSGIAVW